MIFPPEDVPLHEKSVGLSGLCPFVTDERFSHPQKKRIIVVLDEERFSLRPFVADERFNLRPFVADERFNLRPFVTDDHRYSHPRKKRIFVALRSFVNDQL